MFKKSLKILIIIILLSWYGIFLAHKIDLTTSDLGRHLMNGKLFLQGNFGFLSSNFYSYTYQNYEFICHHWGSGLIFFLILKQFGLIGVHLFFIALSLLVFLTFFCMAKKNSGWGMSVLFSLFFIPLISERTEVRPEVFSYLFCGVFFYLLAKYRSKELKYKWLFALPVLEIFWVNTHIYFIFGLFLIGVFLIESLFLNKFRKNFLRLSVIFFLSIGAALANPFSLKGLLAPLNIFQDYGYRIIENQSVIFLDRLGFINNPNLFFFKIVFVLVILSFIIPVLKDKHNFPLANFFLASAFGIIGWLALRNFTLFGLFGLVFITENIKTIYFNKVQQIILVLFIFIFIFLNFGQNIKYYLKNIGFGVLADNNNSADFFLKNNLQGPIFNNYDIGGYLIYHLFPQERVFVDNRPENYPAQFFKEVYIPMQEDKNIWQLENKKYGFNVIFFAHNDMTSWAQQFLTTIIDNHQWAPVFIDNYAIIFLRINEINKSLIEEYRVPREFFSVTKAQ